jgi:predicted amidophosphoribosyltransferase
MSCKTAVEVLGLDLKHGCCTSCHEDVDLGFDICSVEVNGEDLEVCCYVVHALEAKQKREARVLRYHKEAAARMLVAFKEPSDELLEDFEKRYGLPSL